MADANAPIIASGGQPGVARTRAVLFFTPMMAVALLGPCVALGGWAFFHHAFRREVAAAAVAALIAGLLSMTPMIILLKGNAETVARAALFGGMILMAVMIGAIVLVFARPAGMHKMAFLGIQCVFYFVLLAVESVLWAWVVRRPSIA